MYMFMSVQTVVYSWGYFYTLSKILKWPPYQCWNFPDLPSKVLSVSFHFQRWKTMYATSQIVFKTIFFLHFTTILLGQCLHSRYFIIQKTHFKIGLCRPSRKYMIDYSISWWRIIISCIYCTMYPPKNIRVKIISQ